MEEVLAPSETVEEPTLTISIRRAGDVRAPATLDSPPPPQRWNEKGQKMLMFVHLIGHNFIREPLGTSALMEGTEVSVEE